MSKGQIIWYRWKVFDTRKAHLKYGSPMSYGKKVIGKVLYHKKTNRQTNRQGKNRMPPSQ